MAEPATTTPPPFTAENHPSPPSQTALINQTHHEATTTTTNQPTRKTQQQTHQPQLQFEQQSPPPPTPAPPFIPITELQNLSNYLSVFQSSFNDLQRHLNSLKTAVDSLITTTPQKNPNITLLPTPNSLSSPIETQTTLAPINSRVEKKSINVEAKVEGKSTISLGSQLESLCAKMCCKELKRFIVSNLNQSNKIREHLPKALTHAPNPAKLVLESCGKFFSQGSNAFANKDTPIVTGREAAVLLLECFLLMRDSENRVEIAIPEMEEADRAATVWRKRMSSEGGMARAHEIDARGLLFWIGCFGVANMLKNEEVIDLLQASKAKEISSILMRSSVFKAKIPEIIEWMIKNKMEVDAVNLTYTFGLEDRFNPRNILTSFLRESKESWKGQKQSLASPTALNEANKKHLAELKSVLKCLERHNLDPSKVIAGWSITEKILTLEKEISEFDKNKEAEKRQKRKADAAEPLHKMSKFQDMKRSRHLMESGIPSHISGYSASPSLSRAPGAGTAPYGGVYGGMFVDSSGYAINHSIHQYGLRGDPILTERPVGSINGLYGSSPSHAMFPNSSSVGVSSRNGASDLYQFADIVVENEYQPPIVAARNNPYLY